MPGRTIEFQAREAVINQRRLFARREAALREQEEDAERRAGWVTDLRLLFIFLGAIVALAGWGSWTMLIGVGVAGFGWWIANRLPDHFYR